MAARDERLALVLGLVVVRERQSDVLAAPRLPALADELPHRRIVRRDSLRQEVTNERVDFDRRIQLLERNLIADHASRV